MNEQIGIETKSKEIIRKIKLYELGIKDKPDGYDILMSLRGLDSVRSEYPRYGKTTDFKYHNYVPLEYETWKSIKGSFNLSYDEVQELTMWAIGIDPKLEGVPIRIMF